jgi:predicted aminopeptidase
LEQLRLEKQHLLDELRRDCEKLSAGNNGSGGYDDWLSGEVNNAQLNSVATYYALVPAFERLLEANAGDLEKFYLAVERLSQLPRAERRHQLGGPTS